MNSLNQGITKVGQVLLGEQIIGLAAATLPMWYLEGHAVFTESYFSASGRGRSPSFLKYYKAIAVDKGNYKYDKMLFGSFRNYVPNHYYSGYQTVAAAIRDYGDMFWSDMITYSGKNLYMIFPWGVAMPKKIGLSKKKLMENTFDDLLVSWQKELELNEAVKYPSVVKNDGKKYEGYQSPLFIDDEHIVAIKTSLSKVPQIVEIDVVTKTEKVLHLPGYIYPYFMSTDGQKIVWVETENDPRWRQASYSVIKSYDIFQGKETKLSHKTRYLSVGISPKGDIVAAIENSVENINSLVLLDVNSGDVLAKYPTPNNIQLQRPQWSDDGKKIVFISLCEEGEGICSFSLEEERWTTLRDANREDYQTAFLSGDTLFYVSSLSGTENGFLMTNDGTVVQLTNSRFGITDMVKNGNAIWFSDYTADGNKICYLNLDDVRDYPKSSFSSKIIDQIPKFENIARDDSKVLTYSVQPYKKAGHLFNFHSWTPFYFDVDEITSDLSSAGLGASLYSQNVLGTTEASLSYEYFKGQHFFHTKLYMAGSFPVFTFSLDKVGVDSENLSDEATPLDMNKISFSGKVSVPLLFSAGKNTRYFLPSLTFNYFSQSSGKDQVKLIPRLSFYNYRRMATRDIYPKFGQFVDFLYYSSLTSREKYGDMISLKTAFYLPGFIRNSGFRFRYETDIQNPKTSLHSNIASVPRGSDPIFVQNLHFISVDYAIPLFYPDFSAFALLYVKRVRSNLFYDFAAYRKRANEQSGWQYVDSKGLDLLADFYLFRIPYQISAGVRTLWQEKSPKPKFEAVFVVDILGTQIGGRRR